MAQQTKNSFAKHVNTHCDVTKGNRKSQNNLIFTIATAK